jgi:hypothetical protein
MTPQPRLLDRIRERLRLKHYSIRTEQAYVAWIKRFILYLPEALHPCNPGSSCTSQKHYIPVIPVHPVPWEAPSGRHGQSRGSSAF